MSRPDEAFDLSPFCDPKDDSRYSLSTPWIDDGWESATDGRVCVRQRTTQPATKDEKRRPQVDRIFENFPRCVEKWPKHDGKKARRPCLKCGGTGRVNCECPECENTHKATCSNCADGKEVVPRLLIIDGRMIAGEYCLKIQALGDVLYCPDGEPYMLKFSCGELQGAVMPLSEDTEL